MNRTRARMKETEVGRRTGLTLPPTSEFTRNNELENPEQLFDAAAIVEESPNASLDGTTEKEDGTGSILADVAAVGTNKPKIKVRFSIGDDAELDSTKANNIKPEHPVRKLLSGKFNSRESIDTMDLSSVSTAPSVASKVNDHDDIDVESSRQSSEETEIATIVAAAQKHSQGKNAAANINSPAVTESYDAGFDDDDDLIPPPPPDSPRHYDDDDEAQPSAENDVDFPNADNDNDNDGQGFEINNEEVVEDDDDQEGSSDEGKGKQPSNEKHNLKQKRLKDLAEQKNLTKIKKDKKKKIHSIYDESDGDDEVKPKRKTNKKFNPYSTHFSPKGIPGPRTFTEIPISQLQPDTPPESVRRSKRARMAPLEFWRGEKPVYGANDFDDNFDGVRNMPVVVGIAKPEPTPYKKRKIVPTVSNQKKKGGNRRGDIPNVIVVSEEPFDTTNIRQKLSVNDGKVAHLWDERFQEARGIKVVSYVATAKSNDLPISKARKKSEGKIVGKAAQSFQMSNEENPAFPGYIVGHLMLPPKGIKDAESVGMCAQVFTVVRGQANSMEVAFGDPDHDSSTWDPDHAERFLLSSGDNFLVPPGNSYRLQNHSTTTECLLSWTIIRHNPSLLANEE